MMKRRGTSLGTALLVAALLLTLGLTAGSISTSNLSLSRRAVNSQTARNLAESAINLAISRLKRDQAFGTTAGTRELKVRFDGTPDGAEGRLSFDAASSEPYSTNNLSKDTSNPGWNNTVVPAQSVHLISTGVCAGATSRIEAVIFLSRFPYAVACSGPIYSTGGLEVCSLDEVPEESPSDEPVPDAKRHPAGIASNSRDLTRAIRLDGPDINVSGDLQAAGAIQLGPQVAVGGAIRPNEAPVGLPQINIADYDTLGKPNLAVLPSASYSDLVIEGYARLDRSLDVTNGLRLKNGVLFVKGNLDVRGGISGTGAVIVDGDTVVTGTPEDWDGKAHAALLSRGSVRLEGSASAFQSFKGLVYTEGNFSSKFVDLAGVFIANKPDGTNQSQLDNTRVWSTKAGDVIEFPVIPPQATASPPPPPPPPAGAPEYITLGAVAFPTKPPVNGMAVAKLDVSRLVWNAAESRYEAPPGSTLRSMVVWRIEEGSSVRATFPGADLNQLNQWVNNVSASTLSFALDQATQLAADAISRMPAPSASPSASSSPSTSPSPTTSPTPPPGSDQWSLDLSRFIQIKDRMRVLLWREL